MEKAKNGKMRQVNAVNGSQLVVKLRDSYYRRVKEKNYTQKIITVSASCTHLQKYRLSFVSHPVLHL